MNIFAAQGVAVREFPLTTGSADYLLYADAKVIGVVEAKPEGFTLTGAATQSDKYLKGFASRQSNGSIPCSKAKSLRSPSSTPSRTTLTSLPKRKLRRAASKADAVRPTTIVLGPGIPC